jgi:hypothetical protein
MVWEETNIYRFGQEQLPIGAISALSAFGNSGEAATLAGQSISFLLGAANPCGKVHLLFSYQIERN